MAQDQQTTLADHAAPGPTTETLRSGIVSRIGWSKHRPTLYFADDTEPLALSPLVGYPVTLALSDDRVCTTCLSVDESATCADCKGAPPNAQCVWTPGTACTYQDCPFPEFKRQSCSHDFVVYLAATDHVKVGITRADGYVSRWETQGADRALVLATAPNRKVAGVIETCCAAIFSDRTADGWYTSLADPDAALRGAVRACGNELPDRLRAHLVVDPDDLTDRIVHLDYPRATDETDAALGERPLYDDHGESRLLGVRGSMLVTDDFAFNMRAARGHTLTITPTHS